MGADSSKPRRNGADDEVWNHARSEVTVAALARMEAVAQLAGMVSTPDMDEEAEYEQKQAALNGGFKMRLRRLAYSSVLNARSRADAQRMLTNIFTQALLDNPRKQIGGILFYDEQTNAIVQVLEGPVFAIRALYHQHIARDTRHTNVKKLFDIDIDERQYEGFGMKLAEESIPLEWKQNAVAANAVAANAAAGAFPAAQDSFVRHHLASNGAPLGTAEPELLQLTYTSRLVASSRQTAYRLIQNILRVAIVKNPKLQIGGALFMNPKTFRLLQVLEGNAEVVRSLFATINQDLRHSAVTVLSEVHVKARTYKEWGMVQAELEDWSQLSSGEWTGTPDTNNAIPTGAGNAPGTVPATAPGTGAQNDAVREGEESGSDVEENSLMVSIKRVAQFNLTRLVRGPKDKMEPRGRKATVELSAEGPVVRWCESVTRFPTRSPEVSRLNRLYNASTSAYEVMA